MKPFGLNFSGFLKSFFFQNVFVYLLLTLSGTVLETMLWDCGFINFIIDHFLLSFWTCALAGGDRTLTQTCIDSAVFVSGPDA